MTVKRQLNNFALNLWDKRTSKGISQKRMAEESGIHAETIRYIERGQHIPTLKTALQICDYFRLPIQVMLLDVEVKENDEK